jgi:hypothetical protein
VLNRNGAPPPGHHQLQRGTRSRPLADSAETAILGKVDSRDNTLFQSAESAIRLRDYLGETLLSVILPSLGLPGPHPP